MTALATAEDISAAVQDVAAIPAATPEGRAARRTLARRARALSLVHLIPVQWAQPPGRTRALAADAAPLQSAHEPESDPLAAMAARTNIPASVARAAFMRGVRDYAMTSPHLRPPPQLTREMIAAARASSLARRANGDPTARSDDDDLLQPEGAL